MILTVERPKMVTEPVAQSKILISSVMVTSPEQMLICFFVFIQKHVLWKDILYWWEWIPNDRSESHHLHPHGIM